MSHSKRTLLLGATVGVALLLMLAGGCKGFFVNQPSSVTVTPSSLSLTFNSPTSLKALASFSGGSSKDVTNSSTWTSSDSCLVSVSTTSLGQVTAVGNGGSATITAIYNGVSGTATMTAPTGLEITPCGTFNKGGSTTFTANSGGTSVTATWSSNNTSIVSFPSASSGLANFGPSTGTAIIMAAGNTSQGQAVITVQ